MLRRTRTPSPGVKKASRLPESFFRNAVGAATDNVAMEHVEPARITALFAYLAGLPMLAAMLSTWSFGRIV